MNSIAEIGRNHLRDALTGKLHQGTVSEWVDEDTGKPVEIYWKPLTGAQQKTIESFTTRVEQTCMTVKLRALDANGAPVFADVPVESLMHDYDYSVIRAIAFLITTDTHHDSDMALEGIEKE